MRRHLRTLGTPLQMTFGLLLVGFAGYYLLGQSGRMLAPDDAAAVAVTYLIVNILGPGLSNALEQATSRSVTWALAQGHSQRSAIVHAVRRSFLVIASAAVILLLLSPMLLRKVLNGHVGLLAAVFASLLTFSSLYVVRGILGGRKQFSGYAATQVAEGISRLLPLGILEFTGGASASGYGLIFIAGAGFGALAALPWLRTDASAGLAAAPSTDRSVARLGRSFAYLLSSSLLMQTMANLAPVIVTARVTATAAAAAFATAFVLVRIPLFLFSPIQAVLLPRLVQAAAARDVPALRRQIMIALLAVIGTGLMGVLGATLAGSWALTTFFGTETALPASMLGMLAAGTVLMMSLQILQPALLAIGRDRTLMAAWAAGTAALAAILILPGDSMTLATLAQLVGPGITVLIAAAGLIRSPSSLTLTARQRRDPAPHPAP